MRHSSSSAKCSKIPSALLLSAVALFIASRFSEAGDFPPKLPGDKLVVSVKSADLLAVPSSLKPKSEYTVAKTPPEVDVLYYPEQNYPGNPWSDWGEGLFASNGKYYSSIGDHMDAAKNSPLSEGHAYVYEYDPETKKLRTVVSVSKVLKLPKGHYKPGKVHTRIDEGSDGWLYFATHRGASRATADKYHYKGDWIFRYHPKDMKTEVLGRPMSKHALPCGQLDPKSMIFYCQSINGLDAAVKEKQLVAYDVKARKTLYAGGPVPSGGRAFILTKESKCYYDSGGFLYRYDPSTPDKAPVKACAIPQSLTIRAATRESKEGICYAVTSRRSGILLAFHTKTEKFEVIGPAAVGQRDYITTLDLDPTERYLYYMPGAHGRSSDDGTPVIQFDLKTKKKKVIAFLADALDRATGFIPQGTFGSALDDKGATLFITWMGHRSDYPRKGRFEVCALTAVKIPASERP